MKKLFIILMLGFCFCSAGCALHLRAAKEFPAQLKTLYFSSTRAYTPFCLSLTTLLRSVGVRVVSTPSAALFSLSITKDHFKYSRPDVVNTNLPSVMNYQQTATVSILNNHNHRVIAMHVFIITNSLTLNAGQIYTTDNNTLIQSELNHQMVLLVYYWLTSSEMQKALNANHSQTT